MEQIQALSYKAFVEEIPQHEPNPAGLHVDRFHDENVYAISLRGDRVVGMLAIRGRRPFSLDQKLPDLDRYLPEGRRPCEIRLLTVDKQHRAGAVLPGLISILYSYALDQQYDCGVISATTRQLKLYHHFGFVPFGPLVGTAEAPFQPMVITREAFLAKAGWLASPRKIANLLTGPVAVHPDVEGAFHGPPESHRSTRFVATLRQVREELCALAGARHVEILLGSGTAANDAIAAQLSKIPGPGFVVSNGEFGERLADHALRWGLEIQTMRFAWGEPFDLDAVRNAIRKQRPAWLWITACETSAGILNDVRSIEEICRDEGVLLCLDCVSAMGAVPLDLSRIHLASAASGKALAAYPGLSMVFHNHEIAPSDSLPRYFDLGLYAAGEGVPFTHSSNLVAALKAAIEKEDWERRYARLRTTGSWLRAQLASMDLAIVGVRAEPAPHVVTIALPRGLDSIAIGDALESRGLLTGYRSEYLLVRNWLQIATMGQVTGQDLRRLLRELRAVCVQGGRSATPCALNARV